MHPIDWLDDAVRDAEGVELEGFDAAYQYACRLVHLVRQRFPAAGVRIGGSKSMVAPANRLRFFLRWSQVQ